jgi:actin-related protein
MTAAAATKGKTAATSKAATSVKADPEPSTVPSTSVKVKPASPPKKRKRVTKKAKTAAPATVDQAQAVRAQAATPTPPPAHILVIDNGGDTIKFGWNTVEQPQNIPNVTARLQQQWTVLAGDQLSQIQNPNQLISVTRSMERGMIVNLGNQVQVWKRLLDLQGVNIPVHTDTAQAFGWKAPPRASAATASDANKNKTTAAADGLPPKTIAAANCAVLLTVPPHCPRSILDQILHVWWHDFGFAHVGFSAASACAAIDHAHVEYQTCCLVDLGWSATQIVPTYKDNIIGASDKTGTAGTGTAIRRLPVAGRHLINMWKYFCSYRQWNLMDQEWILRNVLQETAYCSMQFKDDMLTAQRLPAGRRPYDREYVLPDQQNNFQGSVRLPLALQKQADGENEEEKEEEENSDDDSDVDEKEMQDEDEEDDGGDEKDDGEAVEERNSDDEEGPAEIRRRLLKAREEGQRRRREIEAEQQVLNVTVERFSIPEVLFRPSDVGLPSEIAGLPAAIVQSIEACPEPFQAALYQSIHLVGGLSQLPNLKDRLQRELRALAPCKYEVAITASDSPTNQAWQGARKLTTQGSHTDWSVSVGVGDSDAVVKRGEWKRLLVSAGGHLV